jgi:N-acetylglucosamine malate deacetylase 2
LTGAGSGDDDEDKECPATMHLSTPRLCFLYAHPDDESFLGVGLACACRAAGGRVRLVTATRGDAGKRGDPPVCPDEALAIVRERELREVARLAGIELTILDYHDRQLAEAPPDEVRDTLVTHLRDFRPHVVVTFDPNGFNRHPDHVAISRFAADALVAAADARHRPDLGPPHDTPRVLWTPPRPPWETFALSSLDDEPGMDFVVDVRPWLRERLAALRAHRTQHLSIERHFLASPDLECILAFECYRQAKGPQPARVPSDDVFEGLGEAGTP